jgi:uncharacterized protein with ParB-like and HNH nuclease domain
MKDDDILIETLPSEMEDADSVPPRYDIVTYPADYTLEGLVHKLLKGNIKAEGFQRRFVWTISQSSRLIESFLLGLPVPAIFLFTDPHTETQIVVDGQQCLMSIKYFFEGYFGEEDKGARKVFALQGLSEESPYYNVTYRELNLAILRRLTN